MLGGGHRNILDGIGSSSLAASPEDWFVVLLAGPFFEKTKVCQWISYDFLVDSVSNSGSQRETHLTLRLLSIFKESELTNGHGNCACFLQKENNKM